MAGINPETIANVAREQGRREGVEQGRAEAMQGVDLMRERLGHEAHLGALARVTEQRNVLARMALSIYLRDADWLWWWPWRRPTPPPPVAVALALEVMDAADKAIEARGEAERARREAAKVAT